MRCESRNDVAYCISYKPELDRKHENRVVLAAAWLLTRQESGRIVTGYSAIRLSPPSAIPPSSRRCAAACTKPPSETQNLVPKWREYSYASQAPDVRPPEVALSDVSVEYLSGNSPEIARKQRPGNKAPRWRCTPGASPLQPNRSVRMRTPIGMTAFEQKISFSKNRRLQSKSAVPGFSAS